MISHSNLNRALHCPLTYRTFCNRIPADTNTKAKINELKEKLILIDKELKERGIDASIDFKALSVEGELENISDATRKKIETEQLKRIGKTIVKVGAIASVTLVFGAIVVAGTTISLFFTFIDSK